MSINLVEWMGEWKRGGDADKIKPATVKTEAASAQETSQRGPGGHLSGAGQLSSGSTACGRGAR